MRPSWLLPAFAAVLLAAPTLERVAGASLHPHFRKKLEARIAKGVVMTIGYQTATFGAERAAEMKPGSVWHLAGATLETTAKLTIGGHEFEAGNYSLKTRKIADRDYELILDIDAGFSRKLTEDARVLEVEFEPNAERFEHLCIDVRPTGDKDHTTLHLEVRFDTMRARAVIDTE